MKHMKHLLTTMAVLLYSLAASAEKVEIDGIWYNLITKGKVAEVTYKGDYSYSYSNEYSGSITLPATVTYDGVEYSVTSIGDEAFRSCSSLTAITIPEGVTSIGRYAFSDCGNLTAINIPEGVTSIKYAAFSYCSSLTAVYISDIAAWCNIEFSSRDSNPLYYAHNLYLNGELLTQLTIPESVTSIGDQAFAWCSSLTTITLPEGVTSIGNSAFNECSSLTAITIPENSQLTSIGSSAFEGCSSLTAINIPESVTSIESSTFYKCSSLTAINIPEGVTSIGSSAFGFCSSLTAINIPEGVTSIGGRAFYWCYSLTAITIPEGVTSIGEGAFSDCSLTTITVAEGNAKYDSRGGCNAIIETNSNTLIAGCSTTIIPEGVKSIGYAAFSGCSSLTAITIPESVTSIGKYAFKDCRSLTAINIPEGVTSIGDKAFWGCSSLTDVYCYAEGVPTTDTNAFYDSNIGKTTLHVPANALNAYKTTAPWSSFGKFETLATTILVEGITLSQSLATLIEGETLSLTATVTPDDATDKSITWSSSNPSVATVDNTGKVTAIATGTATITATANDGSGVKASCEASVASAEKVEIDGIWYNLVPKAKQAEVTYKGDSYNSYDGEYSGSITIPATVTYGGVSYSVTSIGVRAFCDCSSLTAITIPEGVTSIGYAAFAYCRSLTTITIPEGVTSIGEYAFYECSSLTDVYCYAEEVPTTETNAFNNSNIENATLHVPANALNAYKTTAPWSSFGKFETLETLVVNITLSQSSATMIEGGTLTLTATVTPDDATDKSITWSSTDFDVAAVDNKGKVTAIAPGTATIIAKASDGSGVSASCEVTVEAPTEVTITINQYGSGTYCSKYALDFRNVEGLKAYAAAGYNNITGVVTLLRLNTSQPGEGLFIKGEPGKYMVPIMESTGDNTLNMLKGTLAKTAVNKTSDDGLYRNFRYTTKTGVPTPMFYEIADGYTLSANRAYLQIPTAWLPAETKSISLRFDEGEGTTDIDASTLNPQPSTEVYDLYGRRVDNPVKGGIYIIGEKKVIIK